MEEEDGVTSPGRAEDTERRADGTQLATTESLLADRTVCGPRDHQEGTDERRRIVYPQNKAWVGACWQTQRWSCCCAYRPHV